MTAARSRRSPGVLWLARWYGRRRVAQAFDGLFVEGLEDAQQVLARGPAIIAMNHVSWWDAFVVVLVDQALGTKSHCLMDADNLHRLPFFGWIGAVPLRRSHPRTALADLERHAQLLDQPGSALWIFPQGEQRPSHLRPMGLERGVGVLARRSGAPILPLALSYGFRDAPEPTITVSFGAPCPVARSGPPEQLEHGLAAGLDRNDAFITGGRGGYAAIVEPRDASSVPWAGRLLARLAGADRA